jgi:hypothetical protein
MAAEEAAQTPAIELPDAPPQGDSPVRDASGRFMAREKPAEPAASAPGGPPPASASQPEISRAAFDEAADAASSGLLAQLGQTTEAEAQDAPAASNGEAGPAAAVAPAVVEPGSSPSEDQQKARVSLLRSGFRSAEIDAMPAEELLARGLERADVIGSNADLVRRIRELEGSGNGAAAPQESVAETAPTLKEQLQPLVDAIEDEAAVKPLVDVITGLDSRLRAHEARAAEAVQQNEDQQVLAARDRLREQFPQLSDDSRLPALRARMELLARDEAYRDDPRSIGEKFVEVMTSASRSLGYDEALPEVATRESVDHLKAAGVPSLPTASEPKQGPVTSDDVMWAGFKGLVNGEEPTKLTGRLSRMQ